jgi:hypothetical protein
MIHGNLTFPTNVLVATPAVLLQRFARSGAASPAAANLRRRQGQWERWVVFKLCDSANLNIRRPAGLPGRRLSAPDVRAGVTVRAAPGPPGLQAVTLILAKVL